MKDDHARNAEKNQITKEQKYAQNHGREQHHVVLLELLIYISKYIYIFIIINIHNKTLKKISIYYLFNRESFERLISKTYEVPIFNYICIYI